MSVMKFLAVTLLVCAMVVLNEAERPVVCPPGPFPMPGPPAPRPGPTGVEAKTHLFKREYGCPKGWYPRSGRCYLFVKAGMSWISAERHCNRLGAHLASVHDEDVSNFLKWLVDSYSNNSEYSAWLGASNNIQRGSWQWVDRSSFDWMPNAFVRDNYWENCLRMTLTPNPVWDALPCSHALPSVCARRL